MHGAFESIMLTIPGSRIAAITMFAYRVTGNDVYRTTDVIGSLDVPVIGFLHGGKDTRSSIDGAKRMAEKVKQRTQGKGMSRVRVMTCWDAGGDHNDLPLRPKFAAFMDKFASSITHKSK